MNCPSTSRNTIRPQRIAVPPFFVLGLLFYLFEILIVVTIQAFIFAALTAIYIGSAIEPAH